MEKDARDTVHALTVLANAPMTEERIALLARSLSSVQAMLLSLCAVEYGEVESARRFRPLRRLER